MVKKLFAIMLGVGMLVCLTACGGKSNVAESTEDKESITEAKSEDVDSEEVTDEVTTEAELADNVYQVEGEEYNLLVTYDETIAIPTDTSSEYSLWFRMAEESGYSGIVSMFPESQVATAEEYYNGYKADLEAQMTDVAGEMIMSNLTFSELTAVETDGEVRVNKFEYQYNMSGIIEDDKEGGQITINQLFYTHVYVFETEDGLVYTLSDTSSNYSGLGEAERVELRKEISNTFVKAIINIEKE